MLAEPVVQVEGALVAQLHDRRRGEGLRDRADAVLRAGCRLAVLVVVRSYRPRSTRQARPCATTAAATDGSRSACRSWRSRSSGSDVDMRSERLRDELDRALDVVVGDVEVRHGAQCASLRLRQQHAVLAGAARSPRSRRARARRRSAARSWSRRARGRRAARPRPTLRRACARGRDRRPAARRCGRGRRGPPPRRCRPGASRRRSGASRPARVNHQVARAGDQRAERAAEPLREAERHGVESARELRHGDAGGDGRVHEPCTVEVHAHPELPPGRDDRLELVRRPHRAAGRVVGVLEREHRRPRPPEPALGPARLAQLGGRQAPPVARETSRLQPGMERRAARARPP